MLNKITCSAPGSLMLMGEHAVLYGRCALAAAIDQRLFVTASLREDDEVCVSSKTLGTFKARLSQLAPKAPFTFVIEAVLQSGFQQGVDIAIDSDFSHQMGLGSSAAVTVATVATLAKLQNQTLNHYEIYLKALAVVRKVQGRGSGADVAASTYGGVVKYATPESSEGVNNITKFSFFPDISVVFCGYKKPTAEVIALVKERYDADPKNYERLFSSIHTLVIKGVEAIQTQDWALLGQLCTSQQYLMQQLGVSDACLDALVDSLLKCPHILGAKISGSGLGDCVIGIKDSNEQLDIAGPRFKGNIDVHISPEGVKYE